MQTKILFTVNPTGAIPSVTTAGNALYQGQIGTVDYRLEMAQAANLDNWRPTDVVLTRFTRPDARTNQQVMRYVAGGWELTSNGWETDVDISAHGATLTVSFICKRYSTVDATRVVAEKTTQAVTLQLQPSAGYTPLNIADDDAEEILAQLAQYNADLLGVDEDLQGHKENTGNPHGVTKAQVGLGNVKNKEQLTAEDKAVPGGVASLDGAGEVPLAQIPQLPVDKLPETHQKILKDFTVNSGTGVGTKYYTDGTTATVNYPVGEGGAVSSLINVITFGAEHFVGGEIAFTALQTGQADNHYLAFIDRGDGSGFRQTANSVFKGSDGSALISGVAVPFDGRLLVIGAGAAVQFILDEMTGSSTTKAPSQAAVKAWTYSREQINQMLGGGGIALQVVDTLPEASEALPSIIYMLPIAVPEGANYYEEYLKVNDHLELIGTTKVDLTPYAKKIDLSDKVDKVEGKGLTKNELTDALKTNYGTAYTHAGTSGNPHGADASDIAFDAENTVAEKITAHDTAIGTLQGAVLNTLTAVTTTGNPVNIQNTNDGFVDKVKITNDTASAISSPLTGKSVGKNLFDKNLPYISTSGMEATVLPTGVRVTSPSDYGEGSYTSVAFVGIDLNYYKGKTMSIQYNKDTSGGAPGRVVVRRTNESGSTSISDIGVAESITVPNIDLGDDHYLFIILYCAYDSSVSAGDYVDYNNLMLILGTSEQPYSGYAPTAFSIPLKNTSGTVLDLNPADEIKLIDGKYHLNSTELHDDSQDALRSIATFVGQTNLIGDQPFTFDVTEFQLGLESIDAMLTLPNGTRVNVLTKDRLIYITSGEYKGKMLDYVLQEIKNEIDGKQNTFDIDAEPTEESAKLVYSGGVYSMIQSVQAGQTLRTVLTFSDTDFVNGALELDSTATGLVNDTAQVTVERAISGGYVQTANAVIKYSDGSIKLDGVSVPFSGRFVIII